MGEKYRISKEFYPYTLIKPPINTRVMRLTQRFMGVPSFIRRDAELDARILAVPAYRGARIDCLMIVPKGVSKPAPCLVDLHGGGFVFEAAPYQYRLAAEYAKRAGCAVMMPRYRLAPDHPFPVPQEDCYAALAWTYQNADPLEIDRDRIGVGGDSAGGTLSAVVCLMMRDRGAERLPIFQMLIYPWLDARNTSASFRRFTDTPVWNSSLAEQVIPIINPDPEATPLAYRSPVQAESLAGLPPAHIEAVEFDCLHDDGVLYARLLAEQGVEVELHEIPGAMHGFDMSFSAPTTRRAIDARVSFMRRMFNS